MATDEASELDYALSLGPGKDPGRLLARIVQSDDPRHLEDFPVLLAQALNHDSSRASLDRAESLLKGNNCQERFKRLVGLSRALFDLYSVEPGGRKLRSPLASSDSVELGLKLSRSQPVEIDKGVAIDTPRLKKAFLQQIVSPPERASPRGRSKPTSKEDSRKELHLSLLFSPRQKDLIYKKVLDEPMTKTEREYFSRVVKKKLLAILDPELNLLALKALR